MTTLFRLAPRASLLLLVALAGCVTADGVLKADGSGTLDLTYPLPAGATEAGEKKRHTSDHVTVQSLTIGSDKKTGTVKLTVDDVTKLSTAEAFKGVTVTRTKEGGEERVSITLTNAKPMVLKEEGQPGPKFMVTFPGAVKEANHDAKIADTKVTWSFTLPAFAKEKSIELTARYAASADAAAPAKDAAAEKPAAT